MCVCICLCVFVCVREFVCLHVCMFASLLHIFIRLCVIEHDVYVFTCLVKYSIHLHLYCALYNYSLCRSMCIPNCVHTEHTTYIAVLSSLASVPNHTFIALFAAVLTRSLL